ncbi:oxidoreductase, zinc-binding [Enterococcus faecalis EnGen0286]|nr:oxidoreductase, zinc-binding [Enterococcus faecalis EnGen0286]
MMKAALIHKYGQKELAIEEVPLPTIHDNDVLVKIIAASINPIDLKTKDGKVKMLLNYQMPLILGSDFAGIVVSVGKKVQNFRLGDAVYGRVPKNRVGTFAEYIAVDQAAVAMKPKNLTFEEAAAIPLVGLTSYQALHDIMNVQPGQKVLIQAGSGGIGTIAIQLAKLAGAYVATTTSSRNKEWVQALGADEVIDYRTQNFEEVLSDYDYVFDTMGGTILEKAFSVVKPQGKVVTLSGIPNERFAKEYGLPL